MSVLEAMLQAGRDTVPFLLGLWRWWVVPGLVAWLIIVYFAWVSLWRRRGTQILGYAAGAFLVILTVYWGAGRMIASEYEVMGYTSDLFLTICMAIIQMVVSAFAIFCILVLLFGRGGNKDNKEGGEEKEGGQECAYCGSQTGGQKICPNCGAPQSQ